MGELNHQHHQQQQQQRGCYTVLLYPANIVGYCRLLMLAVSVALWQSGTESAALTLYIGAALLDAVDGWLARKLGQCSTFGAWLDVVVDNTARTWLWWQCGGAFGGATSAPSCHAFYWLVPTLEWFCFVCNYSNVSEDSSAAHNAAAATGGDGAAAATDAAGAITAAATGGDGAAAAGVAADWKRRAVAAGPWLCSRVMAANFRQPLGVAAMCGLHVLPIWLAGCQLGWLSAVAATGLPQIGLAVLVGCRLLCAVVEVWCIVSHATKLVHNDLAALSRRAHID